MGIFDKKAIGLDIADRTIEVVELIKAGNGFKIVSKNRIEMQSGIVENGRIKNEKKLAEILNKLFKEAKPSSVSERKIIFGLPECQAYIHVFELGEHKEKERTDLVLAEASKLVPLEIDNLFYYYQVVKAEKKAGKTRTEIMLAATSREVILEWYNFFHKFNFSLDGLVIEPLAVYSGLFEKDIKKTVAIVDLGAINTKVYLFDQDGLRDSFVINLGGSEISEKISREINISIDEAEKLKIKKGLAGKTTKAGKIIKDSLDVIADKIRESLDYYAKKNNSEVAEIVFVGGTSQLPGLLEYLKSILKREVKLGTSFLSKNSLPLEYLEALGLALKGLGRKLYQDEKSFDLKKVEKDSKLLAQALKLNSSDISKNDLENKINSEANKEKKYGAVQSDEPAEEEVTEEMKSSTLQAEQIANIEKINKQIDAKLKSQKVILLIILVIGLLAISLASVYRTYNNQKPSLGISSDIGQYSQTQTINLTVPLAVDPAAYREDRVSGRIIENFIQALGEYNDIVDSSRQAAVQNLNDGEALVAEPINSSYILGATTTPIVVQWAVYKQTEANSLIFQALEKLNANNAKYIIGNTTIKGVEVTESKDTFNLLCSVAIYTNQLIE